MPLHNINDLHNDERTTRFIEMTRGLFFDKRLLLVEDMALNREIINILFRETGLKIDEAENGFEAYAIVKSYPKRYNLVLMDIEMPKMDGLEATRNIRSLPSESTKILPIIAITGNTLNEDIAQCFAAGMNDHLSKPLDMDKVLIVMKKYLCK